LKGIFLAKLRDHIAKNGKCVYLVILTFENCFCITDDLVLSSFRFVIVSRVSKYNSVDNKKEGIRIGAVLGRDKIFY